MNGSYAPWDIAASANFNAIEGRAAPRRRAAVGRRLRRRELLRAPRPPSTRRPWAGGPGHDAVRPGEASRSWVRKLRFGDGRSIRVMFDAFNVFSINTITSYSSGNHSRIPSRPDHRRVPGSGHVWPSRPASRNRSLNDTQGASRSAPVPCGHTIHHQKSFDAHPPRHGAHPGQSVTQRCESFVGVQILSFVGVRRRRK